MVDNCPLMWDTIVLNLIGTADFNPSLPNAYKWGYFSGHIAGDLVDYVDDLTTTETEH